MDYLHPSQMTDEQRRENTASLLDRFAAAHDRARREGLDTRPDGPAIQREAAASARRAARKVREAGR